MEAIDIKGWIEILIVVLGYVTTLAVVSSKVGTLETSVKEMITKIGVLGEHHAIAATTLDNIKTTVTNHELAIARLQRWQAVANSSLSRADHSWVPPNGS